MHLRTRVKTLKFLVIVNLDHVSETCQCHKTIENSLKSTPDYEGHNRVGYVYKHFMEAVFRLFYHKGRHLLSFLKRCLLCSIAQKLGASTITVECF